MLAIISLAAKDDIIWSLGVAWVWRGLGTARVIFGGVECSDNLYEELLGWLRLGWLKKPYITLT